METCPSVSDKQRLNKSSVTYQNVSHHSLTHMVITVLFQKRKIIPLISKFLIFILEFSKKVKLAKIAVNITTQLKSCLHVVIVLPKVGFFPMLKIHEIT